MFVFLKTRNAVVHSVQTPPNVNSAELGDQKPKHDIKWKGEYQFHEGKAKPKKSGGSKDENENNLDVLLCVFYCCLHRASSVRRDVTSDFRGSCSRKFDWWLERRPPTYTNSLA